MGGDDVTLQTRLHRSIVRLVRCNRRACRHRRTALLTWEFAHGDRDNSGFADVVTAPAKKAPITVPGLGKFAPGAGPVVAPDGTVYLGTVQGKLIALHPDGSPFWSRDICLAKPSSRRRPSRGRLDLCRSASGTCRDNRVDPPVEHVTSTAPPFQSERRAGAPLERHSPAMTEFWRGLPRRRPMIWRSGSTEAIMVPAVYKHKYGGGYAVRLIAFSAGGRGAGRHRGNQRLHQRRRRLGPTELGDAFCSIPPFAGCGSVITGPFEPPPVRPRAGSANAGVASSDSRLAERPSSWCPTTTRIWSAILSPARASPRSSGSTGRLLHADTAR